MDYTEPTAKVRRARFAWCRVVLPIVGGFFGGAGMFAAVVRSGTVTLGATTCGPLTGQDCKVDVDYAHDHGLKEHPEWYSSLRKITGVTVNTATIDDLQRWNYCRGKGQGNACNKPPCSCTVPPCDSCEVDAKVACASLAGQSCENAVNYAYEHGLKENPSWYSSLRDITGVTVNTAAIEDLQRWFFCGGSPGSPCDSPPCSCTVPPCDTCEVDAKITCANLTGQTCEEAVNYAYEHGLKENPEWYLSLGNITGVTVSTAAIEDLQRWFFCGGSPGTVCDSPPCSCSVGPCDSCVAANCSVDDGRTFSAHYPCTCGDTLCTHENDQCFSDYSTCYSHATVSSGNAWTVIVSIVLAGVAV